MPHKGFNSGEAQNKKSMQKGEGKHSHGAESVSEIEHEHVGSPGRTGQTFRMPKESEVADHSKVRGL